MASLLSEVHSMINELLGLEQLDALRSGLHDANDWRWLKKLAEPLAESAIFEVAEMGFLELL